MQWVLDIHTCLLALAQLIKDSFYVNLCESSCTIFDSDSCQLVSVCQVRDIYLVNLTIVQSGTVISVRLELTSEEMQEQLSGMPMPMVTRPTYDVMCWHQCLGSLNFATVCDLGYNHAIGIYLAEDAAYDANCMACIQGKQHKLPIKTRRI